MTKISQLELILAVTNEIIRQNNPDLINLTTRQFNAITRAANDIIAAFKRDDRPTEPGEGLQNWLVGDDTGASSRYMAFILADGHECRPAYPRDPGDFGRCHRFLLAVPDTQRRSLLDMAACGPVWAGLVANWVELADLWREESPSGDCPKLYKLMQKIIIAGGEKF